ncbi:hypothetical protein J4212_06460 [Candidatus Woesearchaeota archaeon]|nr:hypothetical protein [Candidatus Woesearchaeota archaeon]
MRDIALYLHIIGGLLLIAFPIIILAYMKKKPKWLKHLSIATAAVSWLTILPSAVLYLIFYPATKTLIKAGSRPWAHSVVMETKEHWGLLLPVIATLAAWLVYSGKLKESKKWWMLLIALAVIIGIMGRIVTLGGRA